MEKPARNFVAEFVGVFALVFVGGGAIMMAQRSGGQAGLLMVALAHGLILALMVSATMAISGHLNPAVTLGFLVTRRISPVLAAVHMGPAWWCPGCSLRTQDALPARSVRGRARGGQQVALDVTRQAITLEAIATFFYVRDLRTAVDSKAPRIGGLAIGLTIAADIMAIGH